MNQFLRGFHRYLFYFIIEKRKTGIYFFKGNDMQVIPINNYNIEYLQEAISGAIKCNSICITVKLLSSILD